MNTINNDISFKAKLNTFYIKENKARWQNIAKEFEAQTKRYPKDTFNVAEGGHLYFSLNDSEFNVGVIRAYLYDIMMELSDKEIAKKLKLLFCTQKKAVTMEKEAESFWNKYGYEKKYVPEDVEDKFYDALFDGEKALIKRHLGQDKLFNKYQEWIEINGLNPEPFYK